VSFFRPRQVPAETLQCIWQPLPLVALSFAIVPKYWRPSADHVWGSVVGSDWFPTCRSRRQAFRIAVLKIDLLAKSQKVSLRENNPPSCPPKGAFLVLKLKSFLA
jgi:hypothetical protein